MGAARINPGARNLVVNCARVQPGERVLVVTESPDFGYYAADLAPCIIAALAEHGALVECLEVGFAPQGRAVPAALTARMREADVVISVARVGDQLRFDDVPGGARIVQCYALDAAALASQFGTAPHEAFVALKHAVDATLFGGAPIEITCARGTRLRGHAPRRAAPSDTTCVRFPLSVFSPVPALHFSGRVALPGFLTGTGSRYYDPFTVALPKGTFAEMQDGRLTGFSGDAEGARRAGAHYDHVAACFGLDRDAVHSWHAGLHPACAFHGSIEGAYERWSGSAFGNPRILHFHTCGTQPPGEICWNVIDPTITVDGVPLWEGGVFHPERMPGGAAVLDRYPQVRAIFASPEAAIGFQP